MGKDRCHWGILVGVVVLITPGCQQNQRVAATPAIQSNVAAFYKAPRAGAGTERTLSPLEAAELGAKLANQECERLYRQRPFKPELWKAVLTGKRYQWGELDVGGPGGFSAQVTFDADGGQPHVEIYLSRDFPLMLLRRR